MVDSSGLFLQEVADTGDNAQAASAMADAPANPADVSSTRVDAPTAHAAMPGIVDQPPSDESQTTDITLPPKQRAPESQSADTERVQQPSEEKAAKKKRKSKNKSARNKARQQRQAEEEEQVLGVHAKEEENTGALQQQRQAEEEEEVPAVQAKQEEAGDLQQHEQEELGWHDAEVRATTCLMTASNSACYSWGAHPSTCPEQADASLLKSAEWVIFCVNLLLLISCHALVLAPRFILISHHFLFYNPPSLTLPNPHPFSPLRSSRCPLSASSHVLQSMWPLASWSLLLVKSIYALHQGSWKTLLTLTDSVPCILV